MTDKLLLDKRIATHTDLFHENSQLKLGIDYVVKIATGTATAYKTREKVPSIKLWKKNGSAWVSYMSTAENQTEYDSYKSFLMSYIRLEYIYVNK